MRNARAFGEFARLFPDEVSTRHLLEDIGIAPGRLRPFGQLAQELYWREVSRVIADGAFAQVTLGSLVDAALTRWPGNQALRCLGGQSAEGGELRVLCLAAGPSDQSFLQLAAEHRAIVMALRRSRRPVVAILHPATRLDDIALRLLDARPHIVHFAGHGSKDGRLLFEDAAGLSAPVDISRLSRLISTVGRLQAVILTSCYSGDYAAELLTASDAVAGSPAPLADECALAFSENFYRALGDDLLPRKCFEVAEAAMGVVGCPPHDLCYEAAAP
jgi:hypothetical protein